MIIIDRVIFSRPAVLYFFRLDKGSLGESQLKQLCGEFRQIADCRIQIQQVPKETICTFNTDLGNFDPFPSLYLFKESLTIQLIIGRFVHYFVMSSFVLVTSFPLKSLFYSFNRLFIHECWHRASISIHPSHPSVCPSIHPSTAYACAYLPTVYYLSFCIQIFIRLIPDFAHTTCLIDLSIDCWSICSLLFHEFVYLFIPSFP